jgi:hypothetical protein
MSGDYFCMVGVEVFLPADILIYRTLPVPPFRADSNNLYIRGSLPGGAFTQNASRLASDYPSRIRFLFLFHAAVGESRYWLGDQWDHWCLTGS